MSNEALILKTNLDNLGPVKRGKVRDIYARGEKLLIIATDRISAFDVILPNGIPGKGVILTALSEFWFCMMEEFVSNHLISTDITDFPDGCTNQLKGRTMLVKKVDPLPVECIVRGYLSGSAWKEYCATGKVCGILLPEGLKESDKLPEPVFTPSTKAVIGEHDENITFEEMKKMMDSSIAHQLKAVSIAIYKKASAFAESKGVIIADTKLEFGILNKELILIDELLTPDSSRFWPLKTYAPGGGQKSMDKQFVRDYLTSTNWDKEGTPPELPADIVEKTGEIYRDIFDRLLRN